MNSKLISVVKRLVREEEGTEVVEWALVCGLIVAVGAGLYVAIGGEVQAYMQEVLDLLTGTAA